jgi:hypothetical protein
VARNPSVMAGCAVSDAIGLKISFSTVCSLTF